MFHFSTVCASVPIFELSYGLTVREHFRMEPNRPQGRVVERHSAIDAPDGAGGAAAAPDDNEDDDDAAAEGDDGRRKK